MRPTSFQSARTALYLVSTLFRSAMEDHVEDRLQEEALARIAESTKVPEFFEEFVVPADVDLLVCFEELTDHAAPCN